MADGAGGLLNNLEDLDAFGEQAWKGFRKWLLGSDKTDFNGILKDNIEHVKKWVSDNIKVIKAFANIVWQPLKENFMYIINSMLPYLQPLINRFNEAVRIIKGYWENLVDKSLKPLWTDFVNFMKPNVIDPIVDLFSPMAIRIYNSIVPYVNMLIDKINETFGFLGVNLQHWELKAEKTSENVANSMSNSMDKSKKSFSLFGKVIDTTMEKLQLLVAKKWGIHAAVEIGGGSSLNRFLDPLRNTLAKIGIKLPYLATGTNYVPADQLAMIHKGEAVIPKKFNSKEYFDNEETNNKLNEVIEAIRDINITPYTTIRDVGKASISYINSKSRQLGESVIS